MVFEQFFFYDHSNIFDWNISVRLAEKKSSFPIYFIKLDRYVSNFLNKIKILQEKAKNNSA